MLSCNVSVNDLSDWVFPKYEVSDNDFGRNISS